MATEEALEHCYPSCDRPSILELTTLGAVVEMSLPECWLCQQDNCLQTLADGVVVHSPRAEK